MINAAVVLILLVLAAVPADARPAKQASSSEPTSGPRRTKILYIEGEPRPELKFLRQALEGDGDLQLVTLMRTAENRFLRLGVDDSLELARGFPTKREELFRYRVIILGGIEAGFFTADQLRMITEFVGEHGGALLVLGSRRSFAEGGYAATPIADMLPVKLAGGRTPLHSRELKIGLTPRGARHCALRIDAGDGTSAERWKRLPALSTVNRIAGAKPDATVLLVGHAVEGQDSGASVVLASRPYGAGTAWALTIQDSWLWRMHADIPPDDQTHERFWRQLLRSLSAKDPGRC